MPLDEVQGVCVREREPLGLRGFAAGCVGLPVDESCHV